jgi:hypothetical protein
MHARCKWAPLSRRRVSSHWHTQTLSLSTQMDNMLPCLFQARSNTTLPPMNTQHWSRSMKLLARTLRRTMNEEALPCEDNSAVHHAPSSRTQKNGHQSRRVVRVKVVLTRAEAARLLSFTEHGDRTAADVVRQDASAAVKTAWRPVPESIPGGATIGSYIVSLHWLNIALYIVVCSFVSLFFTWFIYMCVSVQLWVKRRKS